MGQHQWSAVLLVALPHDSGNLHLLSQFGYQAIRQWDDPIVAAFGASDAETALLEVYVLDAQVQRLGDA